MNKHKCGAGTHPDFMSSILFSPAEFEEARVGHVKTMPLRAAGTPKPALLLAHSWEGWWQNFLPLLFLELLTFSHFACNARGPRPNGVAHE